MALRIAYDRDVDALRVMTPEADREVTCVELDDAVGVVLGLDRDVGTHVGSVVSLDVMDASLFLPLGKCSYDRGNDTLTLGAVDAGCITENGDIVTYWRERPDAQIMDPVGVTIRRASEHLGGVDVQG